VEYMANPRGSNLIKICKYLSLRPLRLLLY
jgi:hypothetical protein